MPLESRAARKAENQPSAVTAPPPNSGHLLVYQVANFGSDLSLILSVDGKDGGSFPEEQNYDGYLSAGQHRLTARVDPNRTGARGGERPSPYKLGRPTPTTQLGRERIWFW